MERRSFVKTSLLTGAAAAIAPALSSAASREQSSSNSEFYEFRTYILKNETQQKLVEDYFKNAAIPAFNRYGIKHIGVFTELKPAGQTKLYVIIPYQNLEQFKYINVLGNLESDDTYNKNSQAYLNAPVTAPAYERIESSLLKAFLHMPKMQVPAAKPRIFELRQYQSASEAACKKKIDMFNNKGEIDIFKRLGFKPVFFAETEIGSSRPNLVYMVTFDDMDAHDDRWKAFTADKKWKEISDIPEYSDSLLITKITSTFIAPTEYSQI